MMVAKAPVNAHGKPLTAQTATKKKPPVSQPIFLRQILLHQPHGTLSMPMWDTRCPSMDLRPQESGEDP